MASMAEAVERGPQEGGPPAPEDEPAREDPPKDPPKKAGGFLAWLGSETGAGELSEYADHPAYLGGGDGGLRIARGFAGLAGSGRWAVLDLVLGLVELGGAALRAKAQQKGE